MDYIPSGETEAGAIQLRTFKSSTISTQQRLLVILASLCLCALLFFLVFGEDGLVDLRKLKQEKALLFEKIEILHQENMEKYREIHRLENDLAYIEEIARNELGMIKSGEIILKPKTPSASKTPSQDLLKDTGQNIHGR
jgi:cell division protein FtsB